MRRLQKRGGGTERRGGRGFIISVSVGERKGYEGREKTLQKEYGRASKKL